MPDGTGLRAEDIDGVVASLEARLGRSLTFGEQCRLLMECIEKARGAGELRECADRLYEEFSKRLIQLPIPKQQPRESESRRPIEEGALVKGGEEEAPPTPRRVVSRKGLPISVVGRRGRPIQLMPEERPVIVVLTPTGNIKCFWEKSYEDAKDFAAYMRSRGGTVLCLGPIEACEEYSEYCGRRPVT